jgi:hypothetical protein
MTTQTHAGMSEDQKGPAPTQPCLSRALCLP